jgi:hypothetical protein
MQKNIRYPKIYIILTYEKCGEHSFLTMEKIMKKLILSSVFAGLVLAASGVEASTTAAPQQAPYGKFVINADFAAGWWANVYHKTPNAITGTTTEDGIDKDDFKKRQLVALSDAKMTFKTEGGCSAVAFGAVVKLDVNAAATGIPGIFRDTYVFGRFGNMIEVRIGSQRDAMWSLVDADSAMGGTGGYNGYYGNLLKNTQDVFAVTRKHRWMLDLTHANDTWYTNALEVRTTRLAGLQAVLNWKPSSAYNGRLGTYGDGTGATKAGVKNNLVSVGLNYDNTFGDFRLRASAGGVYGITDGTTESGDKAATSMTYRVGGIFSWKTLDFGLGWLDNLHTGFSEANKDKNAGKALHGVIGYQLDTVTWKPRLSVGALWGWKNGRNDSTDANKLANQDQTLAFSGAVDLNIRDGFRWFVEGTWAMFDEKNDTSGKTADAGYDESNIIVGTGLAVSQ